MIKKEVIGYIIADNEWLQFESLTHAAEHFNITPMQVSLVIKGTFAKCKGVCFHYNTEDFDEQILAKISRETRKGQANKKKVLVTDLQGNKIAEYNGVREAARQLGINKTTVSRCANGLRNSSNYKFKII
jgi:hypothetical protein